MKPSDWIALAAVAATVLVAAASMVRDWSRWREQRRREDALHEMQQRREDDLREVQRQREEELRATQQHREDELREAQQRREADLREQRREDVPHIEFGIDLNVHGQEDGQYLAEFLLSIHNVGLVQQKFKSITLRVRGIPKGQPFETWQENAPRLLFPLKVIDDAPVIPNKYLYFVEPGVRQSLTYVTSLPASLEYILAHVEFQYDRFALHSAERVFRITSSALGN